MIGLFFATKAGLRPPKRVAPSEGLMALQDLDDIMRNVANDYAKAMAATFDAQIRGTWVEPPPPPPPTLWQRIEAWYRGLGNREDYDY